MAVVNAQLQAVINRFSLQPGITPEQVAQLQEAIRRAPDLTAKLNHDAAAGLLSGFVLSPAGSGNRVGSYDVTSGVVDLPAESFLPYGREPSSDLMAVLRVQDMALRFAQQPGASQDSITNLQDTLNQSPLLAERIKQAASTVDPTDARGRHLLEQFAPLTQPGAGASYDGNLKAMNLPMARLGLPSSRYQQRNVGDMTFIIGHEIEHSFNFPGQMAAVKAFDAAIARIARDRNPINDYTAPLEAYLQTTREDEARAQLAGWNAVLSRVQQHNPNPTYFDVLSQSNRALDFVQVPIGRPNAQNVAPRIGISFNADLSVSPTPANVAQMAQNYYDKPPSHSRLGQHGDSDYRNYYGASAVGRLVQVDRHYAPAGSQLQLDMQRLGLDERLMERNGIHLGNHPARMPYTDSSRPPPNQFHFDHTYHPGGHQHVPAAPASPPPSRPVPGLQLPASLQDAAHPGHAVFRHALSAVGQMERTAGIASGPHSQQLAAAVAVKAEQLQLDSARLHLELGKQGQVLIRERGVQAGQQQHGLLDTGPALRQSLEQHSAAWNQARSPHYAHAGPPSLRSADHERALQQLNPGDRALFDHIRGQVPSHLDDARVLQALVAARQGGIERTSQLEQVTLAGDRLVLLGATPGYRAVVDLSQSAPALYDSLRQYDALSASMAWQQELDAWHEQLRQGHGLQR